MIVRKVAFFVWGAVYGPFMILGLLALSVAFLFYGAGERLRDLLADWARPGREESCSACSGNYSCECRAVR